jgi:hypothetical protein
VGGFVGPHLIGDIKERTGEFTPGLLLLAGFLAAAVVLALRAKPGLDGGGGEKPG